MDIDDFLYRAPLSSPSISVLVPLEGPASWPALIARASALLAGRPAGDELVVLCAAPPPRDMPARVGRWRLRTLVRADAASGDALARAFVECRREIIVMVDPALSISPQTLEALISRLQDTDLALGHGRGRVGWARRAGAILAHWLLGVAGADPLCPIKAMRARAVRGVTLQTEGRARRMELIAKMTFMTCLLDEVTVPEVELERGLLRALAAHPRSTAAFLFSPRFWHGSAATESVRPPLNARAIAAPAPAGRAVEPWRSLRPGRRADGASLRKNRPTRWGAVR